MPCDCYMACHSCCRAFAHPTSPPVCVHHQPAQPHPRPGRGLRTRCDHSSALRRRLAPGTSGTYSLLTYNTLLAYSLLTRYLLHTFDTDALPEQAVILLTTYLLTCRVTYLLTYLPCYLPAHYLFATCYLLTTYYILSCVLAQLLT